MPTGCHHDAGQLVETLCVNLLYRQDWCHKTVATTPEQAEKLEKEGIKLGELGTVQFAPCEVRVSIETVYSFRRNVCCDERPFFTVLACCFQSKHVSTETFHTTTNTHSHGAAPHVPLCLQHRPAVLHPQSLTHTRWRRGRA